MIVSNNLDESLTIPKYSRCSDVRSVSSVRSVIPIMPFIGVRISWLIFARNSLFARFASMARSHAATSSALISLNAVAVAMASALPPTGARHARFPALISVAADAIARIGLVMRLLKTSPADRASTKTTPPVTPSSRRNSLNERSVALQSSRRTRLAGIVAEFARNQWEFSRNITCLA